MEMAQNNEIEKEMEEKIRRQKENRLFVDLLQCDDSCIVTGRMSPLECGQ